MKKLLFAGASLLAVTPALADGDLNVAIQHEKDILIFERIGIAKFITADANIFIDAEKFAESFALVNQNNFANTACSNCAEKQDYIFQSFNNSTGLISANQASGNQNNQGSATSIAYDFSGAPDSPLPPTTPGEPPTTGEHPRTPGGFAESQAAVSQNNGVVFLRPDEGTAASINGGPENPLSDASEGNFGSYTSSFPDAPLDQGGFANVDLVRSAVLAGLNADGAAFLPTDPSLFANHVKTVNVVFRNAVVDASFSGNSGVLHGNQAAGNMNNQANALSLAVSLAETGVALSEADLGQYTVFNEVMESDSGDGLVGINKLSRINGSFNGNSGIIGFNQTTGNMANQANVVSLSVVGNPAANTVSGAF